MKTLLSFSEFQRRITDFWYEDAIHSAEMNSVFDIKNQTIKELEKKGFHLPAIWWQECKIPPTKNHSIPAADATCFEGSKLAPFANIIRLSSSIMPYMTDEAIHQTVLHEVAHIIDRCETEHGPKWGNILAGLGGRVEQYYYPHRDIKESEHHRFPELIATSKLSLAWFNFKDRF